MAVAEGVGGVGTPLAEASVGGPPVRVKFFYAFGQAVESGYIAVNAFVFFYYTAVLGLSGAMVGLAVGISMCLDAAADPLIGSWSDSLRSRFGRRLPVMLLGAPLTMVTMGLLFMPPSGLTPILLFVWLTTTKMGVRAFASMYNIPYFALGGEMTSDYHERAQIAAIRLFFGVMITILINALASSYFFAGEGGLQKPERYPVFGWAMAVLILSGGLIGLAGVWRYASALPRPTTTPAPMLNRLIGEIVEMLKNRTFLILFGSMVIFASAAGIHQTLNLHMYVFVWKLRPEIMQFVGFAYLVGILVGIPATPALLRVMEKKTAVLGGFAVVIATFLVVPSLRAAGLYMPTGTDALLPLCATTFVLGAGSGVVLIAYPAMMAEAADEHEHLHGQRREGLFFSGLGFGGKAAAGVGTFVGGQTLTLLHFPKEAGRQVNAVVAEPILSSLTLAWATLPALMCVAGALVFLPYAINKARYDEITSALKVKRARDAAEGTST